jgi:hypothetical protein
MTQTIRHVMVSHGNDTEKLREAYRIATGLCISLGVARLTILCNGMKGPTEGILTVITDRATAKQLVKGNEVRLGNLTLDLRSMRTFEEYPSYDVVLGIYLGHDGLDKMDTARLVKGVVYVSLLPDEAADWIQRWKPTVHGATLPAGSSLTLPNTVIKELDELTMLVNLNTGITHSSDKARAVETFKKLKANGHHCQPAAVKNWAIGHGWRPEDGDDLAKLAERYLK